MSIRKDLGHISDQDMISQKYWHFPENIKSMKAKIAYMYFKVMYTIGVGKGQVIGRFTNMLPEMMGALYLFEKITKVEVPGTYVAYLVFGSFLLSWIIGYFWMMHEFDRIDTQVSAERNMFVSEMHKNIVKKRRIL